MCRAWKRTVKFLASTLRVAAYLNTQQFRETARNLACRHRAILRDFEGADALDQRSMAAVLRQDIDFLYRGA